MFLGPVVSGEGVKLNHTITAKIVSWPVPKTPRQVKQMVAMGSYYRRYVKNFASMVRPMVEMTKKGKKILRTEACQTAFESMKKALVGKDIM